MIPPARRLLAVHAHPDDESISTGGTLARYVDEGVAVSLVTATLGEEGEILPGWLAGLAAGRADQLGGYRLAELAAATRALGVHAWGLLGGVGRFRDSGMAGSPAATHPRAFVRADPADAAALLADIIRRVRPHVVVTYDEHGGYGHPDHRRTVEVTLRAVAMARDSWPVARVWGSARPASARADLVAGAPDLVAGAPDRGAGPTGEPDGTLTPEAAGGLSLARPDAEIDAAVDVTAWAGRKREALAAHATQVDVRGDTYALSTGQRLRIPPVEYYRVLVGERPRAGTGGRGWVGDLFDGLDLPAG